MAPVITPLSQTAMHWASPSEWIAPPQQKRSQDALTALLRTAASLFARHGYQGTTIAMIAQDAEVSVAAIYRRFRDKAAIFCALVDIWSPSWMADSDRIWNSVDWRGRSVRDLVQFHVDIVFSAYRSDPALLREIERRTHDDAHVAAVMARMDAYSVEQIATRLPLCPDGADVAREALDVACWTVKASLALLLEREAEGQWPPIALASRSYHAHLSAMALALFAA